MRLRHELGEQRSEWQQRIQAQLYHHGCPAAAPVDGRRRARVARPPSRCPRPLVEQLAVALADDRHARRSRSRRWSRSCGRSRAARPGCRALMAPLRDRRADRGHDPGRARRLRRFSSSRQAVRYAGMDITVHESDQRRAPGHLSRQGPPALRWALYEAAQVARRPNSARPRLLRAGRASGSAATARASRSLASCSSAATTRSASSARRHCSRHELPRCAPSPSSHRCAAAGSRQSPAATPAWTAQKDRAAATLPPAGSPHHPSCRRPRSQPRVVDRGKAGRPRAQDPSRKPRARTTGARRSSTPTTPDHALDVRSLHK